MLPLPGRLTGPILAAAVLLAGMTACGSSVANRTVTLADVRSASVVSGGSSHPAANGEKLRKGDRVRTASGGSAALVVGGRRVVLGSATDALVPDGASVRLDKGSLLVDHRRGPGVTVLAGETTVDAIGDGAVRVDKSYAVLVAAISAPARVRTATGASLGLKKLYQAVASGRALPGAGAALQLRHDSWEKAVVPALLADDTRLNDLATGLDGPGAPVVPALYQPSAGMRTSDRLLAAAIGRAAGRDDHARRRAAENAAALRAEGGSWGVVAAIVRTSALEVGTALAAVLHGVPTTGPAPSQSSAPGGPVAGPSPQPSVGVSKTPAPPTGRPTTSPPSNPPPTPPPSSESVIDKIGKLIPTPSPLLDGLLGGL
jgi:hypothetical protein